jgi:methylenetetrahydrofolate reductase (NADPH)
VKIKDHIIKSKEKGKTLFSFEILPPMKGQQIGSIYQTIDDLLEFNPSFIDVTYHREDYVFKETAEGTLKKYSTRKRPGTVAICSAIQNKYGIDAVPHLICGGFTKEDTENALIDLNFLGIDNVLALRGDPRKGESSFVPEPTGNRNSTDLMSQIRNMNQGIYLDEDLQGGASDFCYGGACYPEKYLESPNMEMDLEWMKTKRDLGSEFFVTQMFFDNSSYWSFVDKCRKSGIDVPIIPGIKPIATKSQLWTLPRIFGLDIPSDLAKEIEGCENNQEVAEVGIRWSIEQCKDLIRGGAPVLHFYTMSRSKATAEICKAIF